MEEAPGRRPLLRGKFHEAAFYASLAAGPALVVAAPPPHRRPVAVYALTLSLLFGGSALYHRVAWSPRARAWMRKLDHSNIFLLIAGTYTAAASVAFPADGPRWMVPAVWAGAVTGITLNLVRSSAVPRPLLVVLYMTLGWVAVAALPALYRSLGAAAFLLLAAGGVAYTVGALAYATRWPNPAPSVLGHHEVFHALVLAGAGCHYAMIALALP